MGNLKENLLDEYNIVEAEIDQEIFAFEAKNVIYDQTWLVGHLFKSGIFNKESVVNDIDNEYSHKKWLFITPSFASSLSNRGEVVVRTVVGDWWGVDKNDDQDHYHEVIKDIFMTEGQI